MPNVVSTKLMTSRTPVESMTPLSRSDSSCSELAGDEEVLPDEFTNRVFQVIHGKSPHLPARQHDARDATVVTASLWIRRRPRTTQE